MNNLRVQFFDLDSSRRIQPKPLFQWTPPICQIKKTHIFSGTWPAQRSSDALLSPRRPPLLRRASALTSRPYGSDHHRAPRVLAHPSGAPIPPALYLKRVVAPTGLLPLLPRRNRRCWSRRARVAGDASWSGTEVGKSAVGLMAKIWHRRWWGDDGQAVIGHQR